MNPTSQFAAHRANRSGFTLIELMIVVAIIGVLSAVVVPILARFLSADSDNAIQAERAAQAKEARKRKQDKGTEGALRKTEINLPGRLPEVEAVDIEIRLKAGHRLDGLRVYTWYDAGFDGTFSFHPPAETGTVRLEFPFPEDAVGARNVSLMLGSSDGKFEEPPGVIYDLRGIYWSGEMAAGEEIRAHVTYAANGFDRFHYLLPGKGRTKSVQVKLLLEGGTSAHIPGNALQPTIQDPDGMTWRFDNLVTESRDVIVELPAVMSPIGRVILLAKLAAVGVLLFGAGFWYMSEAWEPGRLDTFRWGHFLLLALTYFLFFIVFAVLMIRYQTSPLVGLFVSALLSLPLLILHVAFNLGGRIKLRFAVTHILPLAVFTLGLVINGVYGGPLREYIYLGAVVVAMAYFTLTYVGWASGRKAWRKERKQAHEWTNRQKEAKQAVGILLKLRTESLGFLKTVDGRLKENPDKGRRPAREKAEQSRDELTALADEVEGFSVRLDALGDTADHGEHRERAKSLIQEAKDLHETLAVHDRDSRKRVSILLSQRDDEIKQIDRARDGRGKAIQIAVQTFHESCDVAENLDVEAEAALAEEDAPDQADLRLNVEQGRSRLAQWLARRKQFRTEMSTLTDLTSDKEHEQSAHTLRRAIEHDGKRLETATTTLRKALEKLLAQRRQLQREAGGGHVAGSHCLACGQAVPAGDFCIHCGTSLPKQLACRQCGETHPLPIHLMALWPPAKPLHCPTCGAGQDWT